MALPDRQAVIKKIPRGAKTLALSDMANKPLLHYLRATSDLWNLQQYVNNKISSTTSYRKSAENHLRQLYTMILLGLVSAFERFLKETAANCIDYVAPYVTDDRLKDFTAKGHTLAAHFKDSSLGKALTELDTWIDCRSVNDKFRQILAHHHDKGGANFQVFPTDAANKATNETMSVVFQLRHTVAHNMGVITRADAQKLQLLIKEVVESPRLLNPTQVDGWSVKLFLDERARDVNTRVSDRLAQLLTDLHTDNSNVFKPTTAQEIADELAAKFQRVTTIAGVTGNP